MKNILFFVLGLLGVIFFFIGCDSRHAENQISNDNIENESSDPEDLVERADGIRMWIREKIFVGQNLVGRYCHFLDAKEFQGSYYTQLPNDSFAWFQTSPKAGVVLNSVYKSYNPNHFAYTQKIYSYLYQGPFPCKTANVYTCLQGEDSFETEVPFEVPVSDVHMIKSREFIFDTPELIVGELHTHLESEMIPDSQIGKKPKNLNCLDHPFFD